MSGFIARHAVRFAHCDPAGFAYYPALFTLADAVIEDWTEVVIGVSRRTLHLEMHRALPTVTMGATFSAPALLGEELAFTLTTRAVGTTSVDFDIAASCDGEPRFEIAYRQVLMEMSTRRAIPWPRVWKKQLVDAVHITGVVQ